MDKLSKILACGILGFMFIIMFTSSWNDSATFDEIAHIPAGYSYLTQQDYRINPEHPPLVKDLSAVPLLFLNLNFPTNVPEWSELINGMQWDMGKIFLYKAGNNTDKILHYSRFPIMLIAILFGYILFAWTRKLYGNSVALLTLTFYALSPTIIAHSRYVTTDIGAAFGFFISLATFVNFLNNQTKKNLIIAGVVFGIAQLMKFSIMLLAPIFVILIILWAIIENYGNLKNIFKKSFELGGKLILIGIISLMVVWPVYEFHILNYPMERQINDIENTITNPDAKIFKEGLVLLSKNEITRPLGEYFFGITMVLKRAIGGNNAYFMNTVASRATPWYFPVLYATKEQLAFHLLTLIGIIFAVLNIVKIKEKGIVPTINWMKNNFAIVAMIVFIFIYLLQSITGNLNIGIRHVLPTLPFIYLLVARQIIMWMEKYDIKKYLLIAGLLLWMLISIIFTAPYFLSYYNILGGGTFNGYKIATDSNYDWGQDMYRLKDFVEKNNIDKIAIDYFGGGNPSITFGDKYEIWWSSKGPLPENIKWLAVSANTITGAQATPVRGFILEEKDTYSWLKGVKPYARAGSSIFIYKF